VLGYNNFYKEVLCLVLMDDIEGWLEARFAKSELEGFYCLPRNEQLRFLEEIGSAREKGDNCGDYCSNNRTEPLCGFCAAMNISEIRMLYEEVLKDKVPFDLSLLV